MLHPGDTFHSFREQLQIAIQSSGDFKAAWPLAPSLCCHSGCWPFLHWRSATRSDDNFPLWTEMVVPGEANAVLPKNNSKIRDTLRWQFPLVKILRHQMANINLLLTSCKLAGCLNLTLTLHFPNIWSRLICNLKHTSLCVFPATKPYLLAPDWSAAVYLRGTHFPSLPGWPEMCDRWINKYTQCWYLSRRVTWKIFFPPANVCRERRFLTASVPDAAKSLRFKTTTIQQTQDSWTRP